MNLVEALEQFNRKERYWLIQSALGAPGRQLDAAFRARLQAAIGVAVPADAWWAMDYHLDWLVGAMAMLSRPECAYEPQQNAERLVEGNQEDMDLVVAFGDTLILVEAKGETSWSNGQFRSKVERLEALRAANLIPASLQVFVVLMSPGGADGLVPAAGGAWPAWLCPDGRLRHVVLDMPTEFLKVTRWSAEDGRPSPDGRHWRVVRAGGAAKAGK